MTTRLKECRGGYNVIGSDIYIIESPSTGNWHIYHDLGGVESEHKIGAPIRSTWLFETHSKDSCVYAIMAIRAISQEESGHNMYAVLQYELQASRCTIEKLREIVDSNEETELVHSIFSKELARRESEGGCDGV